MLYNTPTNNMIAIVDCNSFYCSCESVFRPDIWTKPIAVLSNNDGCIIARNDKAKAIGVGMAGPYFQAKPLIEEHGVAIFSSNYNLYGDMSHRVMQTIKTLLPESCVEIYSVDECFLNLAHIPIEQLQHFCTYLKDRVETWTGIKVSIGVGKTKVLSKIANRLAKKDKEASGCIMVLDNPEKEVEALQNTQVAAIWGIGGQYALKLQQLGIKTAFQLKQMSITWAKTHLGGVVGTRLLSELQGTPCIALKDPLVDKKMIATTRMFGEAVTKKVSIEEAIATYITRAAEKLRRQQSAASIIHIFVIKKENHTGGRFRHGKTLSTGTILPLATNITHELIKPAVAMVSQLFEEGGIYKKAGVILSGLVPDASIQGNLFATPTTNKNKILMQLIDNINFSQRDDVLKYAASGTTRDWKMQKNFHSPKYTTRWNELRVVS